MPATDTGWRVWTSATWTTLVRDQLDSAIGYALDYGSTLEGDWTATVGEIAWTADQGYQIAIDTLDPRTARGAALDRAVAPYVYRQPATQSRYTVEVVDDALVPTGTLFRDASTATSWAVVAGGVVSTGDELVLEAVDTGPVALSQVDPTTLTPITALAQPTDLTYTPGDDYTLGRDVESDSELLRRWSVSLGRPNCPTGPGIYRTLMAISWITAASPTRSGPGELTIYIVPEPVGSDQRIALATAIYNCIGAADVTVGADSETITGADGRDVELFWTVGTTQEVDVVVTLSVDGVSVEDVTPAVEAAIQAAFDFLDVGDILRRISPSGVLTLVGQVAGVVGATLTLDGGGGDITPATATTLLVPGTVTVG